jgi:hypothetical protein
MRLFIALIVIIYLVGIGVELSPTIQAKWNGASASDLVTSVVQELPNAMAWPVRVFRRITQRGWSSSTDWQTFVSVGRYSTPNELATERDAKEALLRWPNIPGGLADHYQGLARFPRAYAHLGRSKNAVAQKIKKKAATAQCPMLANEWPVWHWRAKSPTSPQFAWPISFAICDIARAHCRAAGLIYLEPLA